VYKHDQEQSEDESNACANALQHDHSEKICKYVSESDANIVNDRTISWSRLERDT
jgi:hypothetical protein